jgi:type VI secretion system protein ImpH
MMEAEAVSQESRRFFDFVRGLDGKRPGSVLLGTAGTVKEEAIRFHCSTSMGHPNREVERVWWEQDSRGRERCHMRIPFFGLNGITSPLPGSYLREMSDDEDEGHRPTVSDFLDIFNHRLISLYYRAWLKYRGHMCLDGDANRGIVPLILALGGMDGELRGKGPDHANPQALLTAIAPLMRRVKSPSSSESSLRELLGVAVQVVPYDLRQVPVPEDQLLQLGVSSCRLDGEDPPVLGEFVPDYMGRCEVRIGPVPMKLLTRLQPEGDLSIAAHRMLSKSLPSTMEYRLTLLLEEDATPGWALGEDESSLLGFNLWLGEPGPGDNELRYSVHSTYTTHHGSSTTCETMAHSSTELVTATSF